MRAVDVVLQLLSTADPLKQAAIIRQAWSQDVTDFWIGLEMATNPDYDFDVKGVPFIDEEDDGDVGSFDFSAFYDLALKLANRDLTARAADSAIYDAAGVCNITEWNQWYRRILLKNLPQVLPMIVIQNTLVELTTE
jgi:hypothetical protein